MHELATIQDSKIIIAALDWGFGHTTRTLVLLKQLQEQGNSILFVGNKQQTKFISAEIQNIKTDTLNGYDVKLDSRKNTYWEIGKQLLKINRSINQEHKWLKEKLKKESFDYVISDNRYGFYHTHVPSIILTHQITLQIPIGKALANTVLRKRINRFSACWVPDFANQKLSGKLSNGKLTIPKYFIGPLSRFNIVKKADYKYDYLFIISGPEPECRHFLESVLALIKKEQLNAFVAIPFAVNNNEQLKNFNTAEAPNSKTLENIINSANLVVAKAGYTTIMDLVPKKKSSFFLGTKGQYEQLYLSQLHISPQHNNSLRHLLQ